MSDLFPELRPVVISGTVTTDDIKTVQDCDEAMTVLSVAIIRIESGLSRLARDPQRDEDEYDRLKTARRFKMLARQLLERKRIDLHMAERRAEHVSKDERLIQHFRTTQPQAYAEAVAMISTTKGDAA